MTIVAIEAPENRSLAGILAPALRAALFRLDRMKQATAGVSRALKALAGYAKLKVKCDDLEVALDFEPEPGLADSGDLDADLADLIVAVRDAAQERQSPVVLVIDELQYVPTKAARRSDQRASSCHTEAPAGDHARRRAAPTPWADESSQVLCRAPVRVRDDRPTRRSGRARCRAAAHRARGGVD